MAWGDYDNDGDLDILLTGLGPSISRIYRNDGGTFTDIEAGLPGVNFSSVAWGDYDNDDDLDILLTGQSGSEDITRIYRNDSTPFYAGDANRDGEVGFADFLALSAHFGNTDARWEDGDFTGDGEVTFEDFVILANNFGNKRAALKLPQAARALAVDDFFSRHDDELTLAEAFVAVDEELCTTPATVRRGAHSSPCIQKPGWASQSCHSPSRNRRLKIMAPSNPPTRTSNELEGSGTR